MYSHILQGLRQSQEVTYCYYARLVMVLFKVRECSNYLGHDESDMGADGGARHRDPAEAGFKQTGFRAGYGSKSEALADVAVPLNQPYRQKTGISRPR